MVVEAFRRLGAELERVPLTDDPLADLEALVPVFRLFFRAYPRLTQLMFSRPFADLEPGAGDVAAGASVREAFTGRIQRCVDARVLAGDVTDMAHVMLGLAQGLGVQELAGWLGPSARDVERRWKLGVRALLDGLRRI
jgi:AcrR family transcriptional regulator